MPTLLKLFGNRLIVTIIIILCIAISECKVDKKNESYNSSLQLAENSLSIFSFRNAANYFNKALSSAKNSIDSLKIFIKIYNCYDRIDNDYAISQMDSIYHTIEILSSHIKGESLDLACELQLINAIQKYRSEKYFLTLSLLFELDKKEVSDSLKALINYRISNCFKDLNVTDSSYLYIKRAAGFSRNNNFDKAVILNALAYSMNILGKDRIEIMQCRDTIFDICVKNKFADTSECALIYTYNGMYQNVVGNYHLAMKSFDKAEFFFKLNGDERGVAMALLEKATILAYYRKFDLALSEIEYTINFYRKIKSTRKLLESLRTKAYILFLSKQYELALDIYKEALEMSKKANPALTSWLSQNVGWCYTKMGKYSDALEYFKISEQLTNPKSADNIYLQCEKSRLFILKNDEFKAIKILDKTYNQFHILLNQKNNYSGYFFYWYALAYANLKNFKEGFKYYQKSIIASIEPDSELNDYEVPEFKINEIVSHDNLLDALNGKAAMLNVFASESKNLKEKEFYLQKCLEHYEKAREVAENHNKQMDSENDRLSFTNKNSPINENVLNAALQLYYLTCNRKWFEKAFLAADHGKANVVAMSMHDDAIKRISGVPDSIINTEKKNREEIALLQNSIRDEKKVTNPNIKNIIAWEKNLPLCMTKLEKYTKSIEIRYPQYSKLKFTHVNLNMDSLKRLLNNNKVMIEYVLTADSLYIFNTTNKSSTLFTVANDSIDYKIKEFRKLVEYASESSYTLAAIKKFSQNAYWLYKKLIQPLGNTIKGKDLVIIPDGTLALIPFEALVTSPEIPNRPDYGILHYLLKQNNISYAYSATLLSYQERIQTKKCSGLLAFAPIYDNNSSAAKEHVRSAVIREKLLPLPGARDEIYAICKVFGGVKRIGEKASEEYFKKNVSECKIQHLAMHTIVDDENPMYSKLVFAPGKDSVNDGFLNTYEIYNLQINAPLVVLSACNTAKGKLMKGEGLISLARGFISAGCPSMVVTMWSVADKSSVRLMKSFYSQLNAHRSIDYSLRLSKLDYLNSSDSRTAHPYYWAGFIQTGKTNPIEKDTATLFWWLLGILGILLFSILIFLGRKLF